MEDSEEGVWPFLLQQGTESCRKVGALAPRASLCLCIKWRTLWTVEEMGDKEM